MAYPDSFLNWWQKQATHNAYKSRSISSSLYESLTKIAYSGWRAREREISEDKLPSDTLFEQVSQIALKQLNCREKEEKITLKTSFVDDLGADSFDLVELFMAFEDHFNIEIPDEEIDKTKTIREAIDLIRGLI
jgi:acyl carrier protein